MDKPKRIFVDSSAWIGFTLKKEKYHKEVFDYLITEVKRGAKFFTSDYVLDETFTRLITGQSFRSAKVLKRKVKTLEREKQLLVLWTNEVIFNKSWKYFEKFSEHKLSFTDATIYTFVKDLKIDEVLTLDEGFKKVGLTVKPTIH
ncbi:MAG: type II toxin-antitoxin system VapC family toxin [Patescibacteria group bacterium]